MEAEGVCALAPLHGVQVLASKSMVVVAAAAWALNACANPFVNDSIASPSFWRLGTGEP